MKKYLTVLAFLGLMASSAHADMHRVEAGAGVWMQKPKGDLSYSQGAAYGKDVVNDKEKNNNYAWILVKHSIPVLPNIRLEYVNVENTGQASGKFEDFEAALGTQTALKMKQFDIIPYYNILDNTPWLTVDLGVDVKVIDIEYAASGVTVKGVAGENYSESVTVAIPLVYVRARVEIPGTDIGFEGDVKYVTYDGSTVSDMRVKVDYTLGFIPVIQPAIEVGYRAQKIDISNSSVKTDINIDYSGAYVGLMLRF